MTTTKGISIAPSITRQLRAFMRGKGQGFTSALVKRGGKMIFTNQEAIGDEVFARIAGPRGML